MNKTELVSTVAKDTGLSRVDAGRALDATIAAIEKTLKAGGEVSITGFGKFSVANRAARRGVNPATGERIRIKASRAPKFSAGATLKDAVARKARGGSAATSRTNGRAAAKSAARPAAKSTTTRAKAAAKPAARAAAKPAARRAAAKPAARSAAKPARGRR